MRAPWEGFPRDGVTLWHVTDSHINFAPGIPVWSYPRMNAIAADLDETAQLAGMAARIHTGDITEHGKTDQVDAANTWINTNMVGMPSMLVYGNHDFGNGWVDYKKDRPAVEADYGGRSALSDVYCGPPDMRVRLLGIAPDSYDTTVSNDWMIPPATVAWLDARLAEDRTTPTFICCHFSMAETQPEADFADLLSAYPQVCGWICGHAHFQVTDPKAVMSLAIGNRTAFPQFCGPSPTKTLGVASGECAQWPYRSFVITYRDADRIEVRYRDHGARLWVPGEFGAQATILTPS